MLTMKQSEIKDFLDDLLLNALPKGEVERLNEFYTEDVVGHQNCKDFYLEDIKERSKVLKKNFAAFKFKVENFTVIDNFIVVMMRQQWLEKQDKEFYEMIVTATYRILNNKICELWILADRPVPNYQDQNENFKLSFKLFNIAEKARRNFISQLCMSEFFTLNPALKLSDMEKECLYCYLHGFTAKETGKLLSLSPRTIETHIANVKNKFNCHTKDELRNLLFPMAKK